MTSIPYPRNQEYIPQKSPDGQLIVKPTLEDALRHNANVHYEPMEYGGMEDDGISSLDLRGAAIGLMG